MSTLDVSEQIDRRTIHQTVNLNDLNNRLDTIELDAPTDGDTLKELADRITTRETARAPIGPAFELKSADFIAVAGHRYQVDTSAAAVACTLPASATAGDEIEIEDELLSFNTHNLTLVRNGLKINSGTSNFVASVNGTRLSIVYISAAVGWSIK